MSIYNNDNHDQLPSALSFGGVGGNTGAAYNSATATFNSTYTYGGVAQMLNVGTYKVFWCPSDTINTNSTPAGTNDFTSYRYRFVIWWNSCRFSGLKSTDFFRPSSQAVYDENYDFHYNRTKNLYPNKQPIVNAFYADSHAAKLKVVFNYGGAGPYDPNWFTYGPGDQLNTGAPNIGDDVHTGYDIQ